LRPGLTPERKALLERTAHYLDSIRPYAAQDAALATEIAGAYEQLGVLYEPVYRNYALLAYSSAAQTLEQASGGDLHHGLNRAQWAFIVGRITTLGGSIPVYVPVAPERDDPKLSPGKEAPRAQPQDQDNVPREQISQSSPAPVPPAPGPAVLEEVLNRLKFADSAAKIADESYEELKTNLARNGQSPHPDIISNYKGMQIALNSAHSALEKGDLTAARTNIEIAIEHARRVMKVMGR
jgi:hypothetical protein